MHLGRRHGVVERGVVRIGYGFELFRADFEELMAAMGGLLGLEDFAPDEDGFCTLESKDGAIDIGYIPEAHGLVLLHAVVQTVREEKAGAAIRRALETNCGLRRTKQATLSFNPETGSIELARFFALELLDPEALLMLVETFAATLMEVRGLFGEDGEDVPAPREEGGDDAPAGPPSGGGLQMGRPGFMRV